MPTKKIEIKTSTTNEKLVAIVINQMNNALSSLKEQLDEKIFVKRKKKVLKKLFEGIDKKTLKPVATTKKLTSASKKQASKTSPGK